MTRARTLRATEDKANSSAVGSLLLVSGIFLTLVLFLIFLRAKYGSQEILGEMSYHIRGKLARTLYNRLKEDENNRNCSHDYWYTLKTDQLPTDVCEIFLQCRQDSATEAFLQICYEKSDWLFTQMYHGVVGTLLSLFMTQTSINGLLRRGSMFVFSGEQFQDLLGVEETWTAKRMLDLGAGDGEVTKVMSAHFEEVYVTEMSTPMLWILKAKGYMPLGLQEWKNDSLKYDLISCLNVLDRCDEPLSLLEDMRRSLVPETGRLVIALVLPYRPYVEYKYRNHQPAECIPVQGTTFEEQTTSLIKDFFEPSGFNVVKFTRVPYLCEGDLEHAYYVLHDVVFVLSVRDSHHL